MNAVRRALAAVADARPDALMVAGAGGLAYGAWLVYEPAGFIIGGAILLVAGYLTRGAAA